MTLFVYQPVKACEPSCSFDKRIHDDINGLPGKTNRKGHKATVLTLLLNSQSRQDDRAASPVDDVLERAINGDREAMGILYSRHRTAIFRYFYYRLNDKQAADDLTSDVFVRMIESLPTYEQRGVPFRAWLFTIARNLATDYYRRHGRYDKTELDDRLPAQERSPAGIAHLHLTGEALHEALRMLNDDQRETVILRFVLDMPIAETAQTLQKTENAIKGLQYRGLKALRRVLSEQDMRGSYE